jgi:hypothetical protein
MIAQILGSNIIVKSSAGEVFGESHGHENARLMSRITLSNIIEIVRHTGMLSLHRVVNLQSHLFSNSFFVNKPGFYSISAMINPSRGISK